MLLVALRRLQLVSLRESGTGGFCEPQLHVGCEWVWNGHGQRLAGVLRPYVVESCCHFRLERTDELYVAVRLRLERGVRYAMGLCRAGPCRRVPVMWRCASPWARVWGRQASSRTAWRSEYGCDKREGETSKARPGSLRRWRQSRGVLFELPWGACVCLLFHLWTAFFHFYAFICVCLLVLIWNIKLLEVWRCECEHQSPQALKTFSLPSA